jgi:prepilin-type N-terminal cleavage/methylation domain-containing protein
LAALASRENAAPTRGRAAAFTLIETMVAIVLMGLLAGGVVLSLASPLQSSRRADAVESVRSFDATARVSAGTTGRPVRLEFDLANSTLTRLDGPDLADVRSRNAIPQGFSIDDVRIGGQDVSVGRVIVDISANGWSRTYQVHLCGPRTDTWIVFAGLTGQASEVADGLR